MRLIGFILVIMPFFVSGQDWNITKSGDKTLDQYIRDFSEVDGSAIHAQDFLRFVERLDEKGERKNTVKFCRTLFQKTRQEFLRNYTQYASFGETLSKGKYNCLTGTTLYAMLLERFNIRIHHHRNQLPHFLAGRHGRRTGVVRGYRSIAWFCHKSG